MIYQYAPWSRCKNGKYYISHRFLQLVTVSNSETAKSMKPGQKNAF